NRPYVRDALQGQKGLFYGVGKTTGEPGLFVSAPVYDAGAIVGVVAVKVRMQPIVDTWTQLRDPVFVTDARGILFLGSVRPWLYNTTHRLADEDILQVQHDEQYGGHWAPRPVPWKTQPQGDQPGVQLHVSETYNNYLALAEALPDL